MSRFDSILTSLFGLFQLVLPWSKPPRLPTLITLLQRETLQYTVREKIGLGLCIHLHWLQRVLISTNQKCQQISLSQIYSGQFLQELHRLIVHTMYSSHTAQTIRSNSPYFRSGTWFIITCDLQVDMVAWSWNTVTFETLIWVALEGFVLQPGIQIIQACLRIYDDIYQHDLLMSSKYPIVITIFDVSPSATDDNH